MSPLTPDERADYVEELRMAASLLGERAAGKLRELADKLEAEPDEDQILDACAEHVSRRLNPQAWGVVETMKPATREEYEEALRSEAWRALATMPDPPVLNAETVICCDDAVVATSRCGDAGHGCETLSELIDNYSNPRSVERERDEAQEALRELADVAERVKESPDDLMTRLHLSLVLPKVKRVLEGVERTHAFVELSDLARAVREIRGRANLCQGAGLADEAASLRAFADRIEVRAADDGTPDPER